jgi:His-Xaa-Ser system radical SAM maturase HxsC
MIPLILRAESEGVTPYVTRLSDASRDAPGDCVLVGADDASSLFSGPHGMLEITGARLSDMLGDVLLVDPVQGRAERLIRANSKHNTLLVTERCDQLCVMCSQPPKKTHVDRFEHLEASCLLAPEGALIGITGGEPTLYKVQLLSMIERVLESRPDLGFHVLTNAQHFDADDVVRLRDERFRRVVWGIPLYSMDPATHDCIVAKPGAFERLHKSLHVLLRAGARIELRTVLLQQNAAGLRALAEHLAKRLRFIEVWSIMQLENIGFARNRWSHLYLNHRLDFSPVAAAVDHMELHGVAVRLFNFPRCSVPQSYRQLAAASISDWKKKFMPGCESCSEQDQCTGFFEWHPDDHCSALVTPL